MDINQLGFGRKLKYLLPMLIHFLTKMAFVAGQFKTISVPEGVHAYPKILAKVKFHKRLLRNSYENHPTCETFTRGSFRPRTNVPQLHLSHDTEIEIPSNNSTVCSVDSVRFTPPNGLRSTLKPKLFGVKDFKKSDLKRKQRSVEDATSLAPQNHSMIPNFQTDSVSITQSTRQNAAVFSSAFVTEKYNSTGSVLSNTTKILTTEIISSVKTTPPAPTQNQSTPSTGTATSAMPPPALTYHLVQLYDLDREKEDKHLVTVHCFEEDAQGKPDDLGDIYLVEVEDINDNSPTFEKSSLESSVSKNITSGDAALLLKATDADVGINALLRFGMVRGTERLKYKNETKKVHSPSQSVAVLPSGYVIMIQKYEREVTITFKVTVKDRGDYNDGNRATATATINIYETFPPSSSASSHVKWWWIVLPCAFAIFLVTLAVALIFKRFTRKRRNRRDLLVIDDGSFLDNDGNSDIPVGDFRHSREDSDHALPPSNSDALIT